MCADLKTLFHFGLTLFVQKFGLKFKKEEPTKMYAEEILRPCVLEILA